MRTKLLILSLFGLALLVLLWQPSQPSARPPVNSEIIMEMEMVPVTDSPGDFILEYSNGQREYLRKDGKRFALDPGLVK